MHLGFARQKKETVSLRLLAIRSGRKRTKPLSFMAEDTCDDRRRKIVYARKAVFNSGSNICSIRLEKMIKQR